MTLAEKIKDFRRRHLLNTRQASELFGVSQAEIWRLESGIYRPQFITEAKWEKRLEEAEKGFK